MRNQSETAKTVLLCGASVFFGLMASKLTLGSPRVLAVYGAVRKYRELKTAPQEPKFLKAVQNDLHNLLPGLRL